MALSTVYLTVPFVSRGDGVLRPGPPRRSLSRPTALAQAERLAAAHAGVVVLCDRSDPSTHMFLEPLLVCVIGDVPWDLLGQLAAA